MGRVFLVFQLSGNTSTDEHRSRFSAASQRLYDRQNHSSHSSRYSMTAENVVASPAPTSIPHSTHRQGREENLPASNDEMITVEGKSIGASDCPKTTIFLASAAFGLSSSPHHFLLDAGTTSPSCSTNPNGPSQATLYDQRLGGDGDVDEPAHVINAPVDLYSITWMHFSPTHP